MSKKSLACVHLGSGIVCRKGLNPKALAGEGKGHWHGRVPCTGSNGTGCDQFQEIKGRPAVVEPPAVHAKAPRVEKPAAAKK